jgi:hypothetical protein
LRNETYSLNTKVGELVVNSLPFLKGILDIFDSIPVSNEVHRSRHRSEQSITDVIFNPLNFKESLTNSERLTPNV